MIEEDKVLNNDAVLKTIEYLTKKGYENIKADAEGYETPNSFSRKNGEASITPDIVAEKGGKKHYFDIGMKSEKPRLLKTKWQLLDTISTIKNRPFKIVTLRGHYKFTSDALAEINLNKTPIRI